MNVDDFKLAIQMMHRESPEVDAIVSVLNKRPKQNFELFFKAKEALFSLNITVSRVNALKSSSKIVDVYFYNRQSNLYRSLVYYQKMNLWDVRKFSFTKQEVNKRIKKKCEDLAA